MAEWSNALIFWEYSVEGREFKSRSPQRKLGNKTRAKIKIKMFKESPDNHKKANIEIIWKDNFKIKTFITINVLPP